MNFWSKKVIFRIRMRKFSVFEKIIFLQMEYVDFGGRNFCGNDKFQKEFNFFQKVQILSFLSIHGFLGQKCVPDDLQIHFHFQIFTVRKHGANSSQRLSGTNSLLASQKSAFQEGFILPCFELSFRKFKTLFEIPCKDMY